MIKRIKLMKYLNLLTIVLLLFACSEEDNIKDLSKSTDIKLKEVIFSGCKGNNVNSLSSESILIIPTSENSIKVTHQNVMFNCCIENPNVKLDKSKNEIVIKESSTNPVCNCICPYDIEFSIENIEPGSYDFIVYYENLQKIKLSISIPLEEDVQAEL